MYANDAHRYLIACVSMYIWNLPLIGYLGREFPVQTIMAVPALIIWAFSGIFASENGLHSDQKGRICLPARIWTS